MTARRLTALAILALLFTAACDDDENPMGPEPPDVPVADGVFLDDFADNVTFQAFADSKADGVEVDATEAFRGSASLKITVPGSGDAAGYVGGALTSSAAWDLSGYTALSFWARASKNATLDVAGFGNDNTGSSQYQVEVTDLGLSGVWQKFIIPIPDPSSLSSEAGLFYFAEGREGDESYTIWLDDIRFESVEASVVRASMGSRTLTLEVGSSVQVEDLTATVNAGGVERTVSAMPAYFTFASSDDAVAAVLPDGTINVVGSGSAVITASLGDIDATGSISISTGRPLSEPAPTPTQDPADVISLFSNAYDDVTVDTWSAEWPDDADVEDAQIQGDDMKLYTNLNFAGIEFTSQTIDATSMTHFHMDIWTPDATDGGEVFKIKLVDFGANGVWEPTNSDNVEHEISVTAPTLKSNEWVSIDVPLTEFVGLTTRAHMAQLIISGDPNTVYVDNVYFYQGGPVDAPSTSAPVPAYDAVDVISLFSDSYTDVTVDTWSAVWDNADVSDETAGGNPVKKYSGLVFAGIEFTSAPVDASAMTNFRMDIWTPDATDAGQEFKIKLVDFGADGAFDGGDDVEHEVTLTATSTPAIGTGSWFTLDIPLTEFAGLTTRGSVAQLIISGGLPTVFVDNVLFYKNVSAPRTPAPTPTYDAANVVSLFSDAYTDVAVDTWSAVWDNADVADTDAGGDAVKAYTNLVFAGIEFTTAPVDATGMTHFRMDIWSPDATDGGEGFKIKLVDFGADGVFGGDDVEHELTLTAASTPAIGTGNWYVLEIPLTDFTGLTTQGSVAQLIISGDLPTVYVDNVLFFEDVNSPAEAAPTPTDAAADVISFFSDAYTDVTVDTWSASWDVADVEDATAGGDPVKKYTNLSYAGIEFTSSQVDATEMTHFRFDFWTPDPTDGGQVFKVKLVDFGADGAFGGGDDVEHEITLDASSSPALGTGSWVSFDVPLADFTGLTTRANLAQLIISGDPNTVFLDNIYLRK
ncbi:MAG: hypothetical protein JSU98_01910 [Gemmatimonadales bacterium]|jgi:hypothetical protein|nr:MAG: hypothetical protein JSU98_01910 [Gemmatimonadales bacterium]